MDLYHDILDGKTKIAVVGLGYVGLPVAVEFGKKVKTIGFDLSKEAQGISAAIKELIQKSDSQSFAIKNLTKAKNNLFNRITTLEAELEKTKNNKEVLQ